MTKFLFGTVGAPISTPAKPGGSQGAILRTAELGLKAMELGWVQSVRVTEATCQIIKQTAETHQIALSVHAPYFINLNATADEWPKSKKRLMDAAIYGALAGATDIVFHPGSYFGQDPESVLPTAIKRLKDCSDELVKMGVRVTLRPETMGKASLLGSLEDTITLSESVPGVAPCVDFAHLHARAGNGEINSYPEFIKLLDLIARRLGQNALTQLHVHLSGIEYTSKGEKQHLPMRESDFDILGLFRALKDRNCSGRILCESPIMEEDALYFMDLWENQK